MKKDDFKKSLPVSFREEMFSRLKQGVHDDKSVDVYLNRFSDFAMLFPRPEVDYRDYVPRVKKFGLADYKRKTRAYERRFEKVTDYIKDGCKSLIEIGAGSGAFLRLVKQSCPDINVAAVEPDQNVAQELAETVDGGVFVSLRSAVEKDLKYDVVCLFHVLEHIEDPEAFVVEIAELMHEQSRLIIEVPSLEDPLLSMYNCDAYVQYYFQKQHPYIYSSRSLKRLMSKCGWCELETIHYQRYGLENHLKWLSTGKPGGDPVFEKTFKNSGKQYILDLEESRKTDTVIWVGTKGGTIC